MIFKQLLTILKQIKKLELKTLQYQLIAEGFIGIQLAESLIKLEVNKILKSQGKSQLPKTSSIGQYSDKLKGLNNDEYSAFVEKVEDFKNLRNEIQHEILVPKNNWPKNYESHLKHLLKDKSISVKFNRALSLCSEVVELLNNMN